MHAFAASYADELPAARTPQGLDVQTASNFFGPFVLINLLLPRLRDRVVTVSSQLHRFATLMLDDLDWRTRPYHPLGAYEASKLAVVLFSLELQRRLTAAGHPVRSIIAHPGVVARTGLVAHSKLCFVNRVPFLVQDAERGALSHCCTRPRRTCPATPTSARTACSDSRATPRAASPAAPAETPRPPGGYGTTVAITGFDSVGQPSPERRPDR